MKKKKKIIIMGAGGRDFHNFNVCFKNDATVEVAAFTAAQIPFIEKRTYPPELSGKLYPKGIPIYPEGELKRLIKEHGVDEVVFSYSDVSHEYVMHMASTITALGADFLLIGSEKTMLKSKKPVISVCAVRTGCGKSAVTRFIAQIIKEKGKNPVAIRHPMPYGDLKKQRIERFSSLKDITDMGCTIEEMEEFEHLIAAGITVYAGVDYGEILAEAEKEADIIIWDGGNNDFPFLKPDLEIVVADPLRAGHELPYYPGEPNLKRAGCVVINKVNAAKREDVETVIKNIKAVNPAAKIVETDSVVSVEDGARIKNKNVIIIEDGPTTTHGGMTFGAGTVAAGICGAKAVDCRPYAKGSIKEIFLKYPHLINILPAIGYSPAQIKELEDTINSTPADLVLIATPVDLSKILDINKPAVRVGYGISDTSSPGLKGIIEEFMVEGIMPVKKLP